MIIDILPFDQPIGQFAIGVMRLTDILAISKINRRQFDETILDTVGGPQREPSEKRIREIKTYSETVDATFPTPILLALPEGQYELEEDGRKLRLDHFQVASVVDGQHRLLGLERSEQIQEYVFPVVFLFDATEEQQALIFAIINGKQTRVPVSLVYDLFQVVAGRSPFKTAHEIARGLNASPDSAFYRRLKMLGKKIGAQESLSQGTFIGHLLPHISSNAYEDLTLARSKQQLPPRPQSVFNQFFREDKDAVIYKIIDNLFWAVNDVFPEEWQQPDQFILSKTTGYSGIMRAMPQLFAAGEQRQALDKEFFKRVFFGLKQRLAQDDKELTSTHFASGSQGEGLLANMIREVISGLE